jgi:hypothetical protein
LVSGGIAVPFPVSEQHLLEEETKLGRRLPEPLRSRLSRSNGGEIACADPDWDEWWRLYPVWDPTDRRTIGRTANNIVRETASLHQDLGGVFPNDAIAVGANDGGDHLIVRAGRDEIEIWDHETGGIVPAGLDWDQ